jgi:hypothetical protein
MIGFPSRSGGNLKEQRLLYVGERRGDAQASGTLE